jgi:hypothetical protein
VDSQARSHSRIEDDGAEVGGEHIGSC